MKEQNQTPAQSPMRWQRSFWKKAVRLFGLTIILALNFSVIGSAIYSQKFHAGIVPQLPSFFLALLVDITMLPQILLEADSVQISDQAITIKTLFWTSKIAWEKIISFNSLPYLAFAAVKTKHCIYLLNKRDLQPIDELIATIQARTGNYRGS